MRRSLMAGALLALILAAVQTARAQDSGQIIGVWKLVDVSRKEVASGKIDKPYGDKPTGYYIFSAKGHFYWNNVAENRKLPAGAAPTDAERIDLFKSMSFGTGTYKVEGNKVHYHYDSSWIQSWTGSDRTAAFPDVTGAKMTITSAVFKHPITGVDAIAISTYERLE